MDILQVKNWESFQHYKDRQPPWIKLHRGLLTDYEFSCLQDASKLQLMMIWLLASQTDNKIPADTRYLQKVLQLDQEPDLKPLIELGFLILVQDDSKPLAQCKQPAIAETEAEAEAEAETNKPPAEKSARLIPDDWQPNSRSVEMIEDYGVTLAQAQPAIRDFIRFWQESKKKAKNWDLSFQRNPVVRTSLAKLKREKTHGTYQRSPSACDRAAGQAAIDKAIITESLGRSSVCETTG